MPGATRPVTVTDSAELLAPGIERLREAGIDVQVLPDGTPALEAAEAAADSLVIIDGVLRFGSAEIDRLRATQLIIRAGIGYDLIDVPAATAKGIWVANVPDYCVDEVADHALLLLLAATRRLDALAETWRREERWLVYDRLPVVHRPSTQVLGIVGMGRIGAAVARRAGAFGWRVLGHDAVLPADVVAGRGAEPVSLDELFERADAISLHCPLTPETHHLVGAERLARARDGLIVVNTSRGGLVDIDALEAALASGKVAAAGLDVLEDEPDPDPSHPALGRENVIVTSHVAWYSVEARRDLALLCADEAQRMIRGERPRNAVNPEART
jgi:D-3-phosphoglycerate dehydrogenase / 2-oxoglutarate reductase